jgi:beta-lysine N6-acetyltransferase
MSGNFQHLRPQITDEERNDGYSLPQGVKSNTSALTQGTSNIVIDKRNECLVVNGYQAGTGARRLAEILIAGARYNGLSKIWIWALPADVPDFLRRGFRKEGHLFKGTENEFVISLAYYLNPARGYSTHLRVEDEILKSVLTTPAAIHSLPGNIEVGRLDNTYAEQVSQLLSNVFSNDPSPMENPQYFRSLMNSNCIFAGAVHRGQLVSVAAAYLDPRLGRCEITDCATLKGFQGYSLTEKLLLILAKEVNKRGQYTLYSLVRAQSMAMNRVFSKLGYQYQGRLIKNSRFAGSFQDMNLWMK